MMFMSSVTRRMFTVHINVYPFKGIARIACIRASFAIVDPNTQHFPIRLRLTMEIHLNGMYRLCRFLHTERLCSFGFCMSRKDWKIACHWHVSSSLIIQPLLIWEKIHFGYSWLPDLHVWIYSTDVQHVARIGWRKPSDTIHTAFVTRAFNGPQSI